jgi:hypothetical protein
MWTSNNHNQGGMARYYFDRGLTSLLTLNEPQQSLGTADGGPFKMLAQAWSFETGNLIQPRNTISPFLLLYTIILLI